MGLSLTIFRRLTVLYHVLRIMNDYKIVGGQTWYKTYELNVHVLRREVPNTYSSISVYDSKNSFKAVIYFNECNRYFIYINIRTSGKAVVALNLISVRHTDISLHISYF